MNPSNRKPTPKKQLKLRKTSLKELTPRQAQAVAGGAALGPCVQTNAD